jgi:molecular chaperone GrpE
MSRKIEINKDIPHKEGDTVKNGLDLSAKSAPKAKKDKSDEAKAFKNKLKKKDVEIKELKNEIEGLKKEKEELKTEYLRQLADKENLRKRLEREKTEFFQHALSEALTEFLSVLDNFERALQSEAQGEEQSFRDGVEMIYKQFLSVLAKQGVEPIDLSDKKFDPRFHQAFATQVSEEVEESEVGEEYQRGYTLKGRLLRPSLVKVIVPQKEKD